MCRALAGQEARRDRGRWIGCSESSTRDEVGLREAKREQKNHEKMGRLNRRLKVLMRSNGTVRGMRKDERWKLWLERMTTGV